MKEIFEIKNNLKNIEKVLEETENFANKSGLSEDEIFQIRLCLDEVLTNIINYGFSDEETHLIGIEAEITNNKLIFSIIDDGIEFNPLNSNSPNIDLSLEDREIGGLGIFLVKNYMDEINYTREKNKNKLTLVKFI